MAKSEIDAALAAESRNGRKAMGNTASKLGNVAQPLKGKLRPKGNTQSGGDPSEGTKVQRGPVMQNRLGARFAITAKWPAQQSPEAGNTQANGRIIPSTPGSAGNFRQEMGG